MKIFIGQKGYVPQTGLCPVCRANLDAASSLTSEPEPFSPPKPGDFTICLICSTLLRFNYALHVEEATPEGLRELHDKEPEQFAIVSAALAAARERLRLATRKNYRQN